MTYFSLALFSTPLVVVFPPKTLPLFENLLLLHKTEMTTSFFMLSLTTTSKLEAYPFTFLLFSGLNELSLHPYLNLLFRLWDVENKKKKQTNSRGIFHFPFFVERDSARIFNFPPPTALTRF